jgi:two-component system response regulator ResD
MPYRKILLVDNEKRVIDLLGMILESNGFIARKAYSGEEALRKVQGEKYAVAILDYLLPDMKGDDLAERIRIENPEIGLIMLTGWKHAIEPAKLNKFNYVFEKPVAPQEIVAAVKQMTMVLKKSVSAQKPLDHLALNGYARRSIDIENPDEERASARI